MTHLNELYLILNKYLKWNKSHLKCFALIMLVIILKQTCNLSSASKALPIKCLPHSSSLLLPLIFSFPSFSSLPLSHFLFHIFSFSPSTLTFSPTPFPLGKRTITITTLAIVYRGI
ncbi:IS4 family transposase, partial [Acinetobacter baumannii]|nr:IS4 family transposase [Acinetobacter baumannii]